MRTEYKFDSKKKFLDKLQELIHSGSKPSSIKTYTPYHVHEVDHILRSGPSRLRFITLSGALAGFILSFVFIIFTVFDWPMITGGKPLISIPAFLIVVFESTILIGGIVSFIGFLHLSRLPALKSLFNPYEGDSSFIIITGSESGKPQKEEEN